MTYEPSNLREQQASDAMMPGVARGLVTIVLVALGVCVVLAVAAWIVLR